jgi:hypothetical protein
MTHRRQTPVEALLRVSDQVRIAVTKTEAFRAGAGTYPTDGADPIPIVFIDSALADGTAPPTYATNKRSQFTQAYATSLTGDLIPENTILPVFRLGNRWFTWPGGGGSGAWIEFTPDDDFTTADAAFSATVDAVHGAVPDAVSDTVTINNTKNGFEGGTSSLGFCANYDPATDAYYCINLGCPPPA